MRVSSVLESIGLPLEWKGKEGKDGWRDGKENTLTINQSTIGGTYQTMQLMHNRQTIRLRIRTRLTRDAPSLLIQENSAIERIAARKTVLRGSGHFDKSNVICFPFVSSFPVLLFTMNIPQLSHSFMSTHNPKAPPNSPSNPDSSRTDPAGSRS